MKQNNYKPKLGQHFLVDEYVKNLIINSLKETKFKNILEIGPGEGSITNKLIDISNNSVGIEYDSTLYKKLSNRYEKNKNVFSRLKQKQHNNWNHTTKLKQPSKTAEH